MLALQILVTEGIVIATLGQLI